MKLIFILGLSATGKTTLALTYYNKYKIIHADDFIRYGQQAPYFINIAISKLNGDVVVEGVGCYQYLCDMNVYHFIKPKHVIHLTATKELRVNRLVERLTYNNNSFAMDRLYMSMWEKFKRNSSRILIEEK